MPLFYYLQMMTYETFQAKRQAAIEAANEHELDVVRDAKDLMWLWPDNISVIVARHSHGTLSRFNTPEDITAIEANYARLAPLVLDVDVIGVEVARSGVAPDVVMELFDKLNTAAETISNGDEATPIPLLNGLGIGLLYLAREAKCLGRDEPLLFFPVDAFADETIDLALGMAESPSTPLDLAAVLFAISDRPRDTTVVRQTHAASHILGIDGGKHTLMLLVGNAHASTAPAIDALGGHVTEIVVDQPYSSLRSMLTARMRKFGIESISLDELHDYTQASTISEAVLQATNFSTLHNGIGYAEMSARGRLLGALGLFCLGGVRRNLEPSQQLAFDQFMDQKDSDDNTASAKALINCLNL